MTELPQRPLWHRALRTVFVVALVVAVILGLIGCSSGPENGPAITAPPPTFTGPTFLHGTVGSLARLRGYYPLLVSGYGLVVDLPHTGSSDVPSYLRQWLINKMRLEGLGSLKFDTENLTPERVLQSDTSAVVMVQGLIPPGATVGTRFDLLVTALPQTQTTNLNGGLLWTTDLAIDGANPQMLFSRPLAEGGGPTYLNPFDEGTDAQRALALRRQVVVLSGGRVTANRHIELVLNTPSFERSQGIADRINERFPKDPVDIRDTANPISDALIQLHIPTRYRADPGELLALIGHLFVQRGINFEPTEAGKLGRMLTSTPRWAQDIRLAWQALGRTALPVVRQYYTNPDLTVRLTALDAGVRENDAAAIAPLTKLSQAPQAAVRRHVARLLSFLPHSLRGSQVLQGMLDDSDRSVRIAAYQALADMGDPIIDRQMFGDGQRVKFILDLVPSKKPLVYISQRNLPRIVIFGPNVGFRMPLLVQMWDNNRFRMKSDDNGQTVEVFYQPPGRITPEINKIAPTVGNLVYLMGHNPTMDNPQPGLDLSYSQVVDVVYRLCKSGVAEAPIALQVSPLAEAIDKASKITAEPVRPETGPAPASETPAAAAPETPAAGPQRPETGTPPAANQPKKGPFIPLPTP